MPAEFSITILTYIYIYQYIEARYFHFYMFRFIAKLTLHCLIFLLVHSNKRLVFLVFKLSKIYESISCFCEAFTNLGTPGKLCVCLFIFLNFLFLFFVCRFHTIYLFGIKIFNNGRRKLSRIPLDSA